MRRLVPLALFAPLAIAAQRPAPPKPHPLPVVGASREHFEAVDAVTIGERIFVAERGASGGWLRVYDASDLANPLELREAMAPVVGRPLAIAGDGSRVLVASVTGDTTRVRLTLFDVARADRSRWSGAASLTIPVPTAGVEEMEVAGTRAIVKMQYGELIQVDLAQLERDFAAAVRVDETSAAARTVLRALASPGAVLGDDALLPLTTDTLYRNGGKELYSTWEFLQYGQLDASVNRRGALIRIGSQWQLDLIDAATHRVAFTTRIDAKNVNSITASDGFEVLVNDLVRVDTLGARRLGVFNATILGAKKGKYAWEGGTILDLTNPAAPRALFADRSSATDTANLRYGWHSYVRAAVFAREAVVLVGYDATLIAHLDDEGRVTRVDSTGRFAGRLVAGPDGTVIELSVESNWRDTRRAPLADSTAPALRIRTTVPRIAVRDAPAAVTVDDRGATSVGHRFRFEIVSPTPVADPARLEVAGGMNTLLPVSRRGGLLEARVGAVTQLGRGVVTLSLTTGGAAGRWVMLAVPATTLAAGTTRSFVALDDPFSGAAIVVPDSGSGSPTDAAFTDARLRARLSRDSSATVFIAPGARESGLRVVRRDRGGADIAASQGAVLWSYPAPPAFPAVAALRHLGRGPRLRLSLCLRDALGKRVEQEFDLSLPQRATNPPCGDAAALREWLRRRGVAIVEGPDAAIAVDRNHLPPVDTLVEKWRLRRWTTARTEVRVDSGPGWVTYRGVEIADAPSLAEWYPSDSAVTRRLTPIERAEIARALAASALVKTREYAATDSTDSTVAVIRHLLTAQIVPGDTNPATVYVSADQWGSTIVGDFEGGRFVPRWEAWTPGSYTSPELIDLDGDGIDEFVFTTFGHDAKGHVTDQSLSAFDRNGRELTRQPLTPGWDEEDAVPISTEVQDSEYCDTNCGGLSIGRPRADGTRPILTAEGEYVLRDGRYVLQPPPPKPKPAAKKKPAAKRAPKKR